MKSRRKWAEGSNNILHSLQTGALAVLGSAAQKKDGKASELALAWFTAHTVDSLGNQADHQTTLST
jgi:hypothetical protein